MNAARYLEEVIRPQVIPLARRIGVGLMFIDDNAPCHRAAAVQHKLNLNNITRLDLPARFPDMNALEQAWDMLGRAVHNVPAAPQTLQAPEAALTAQ